MKIRTKAGICVVTLLAMAVGSVHAKGKAKEAPAPEIQLTDSGNKLVQKYSEMLATLKAELSQSMPAVDVAKKEAFLKAIAAESDAAEQVKVQQGAFTEASKVGALRHAETMLSKNATGLAEATKDVKNATAAVEANKNEVNEKALAAAKDRLAKAQANADTYTAELKKAQEEVEKAKPEAARFEVALNEANAAYTQAVANRIAALKALGADLLKNDKSDGKLAKYAVLSEATPKGLAEFAQQGPEQEALVDQLLSDEVLMKQMVINEGAKDGKYGQAMQIYTQIQKASPKAKEGMFQRLALATALEHATPINQTNPQGLADAPKTVDPVRRYTDYEKAFLDGELDPNFKILTVWDYRMVVDGDEPSETLAWGRQMLRNYRPDLVTSADLRWRYVESVKTEVKYGSADQKNDLPTLHPYQNMIMNGGVCGRRAFFGRFILRAFGVPTTARPQPGHAALVHWTPSGWVINLGAGWGTGTTKTRYQKDTDFLAVTQARAVPQSYMEVVRAYWYGDLSGEQRAYGFDEGKKAVKPGFWSSVALCRRQEIVDESKAIALAAVGTDIGEANESKVKDVITTAKISDADRQIVIAADGTITIPAVACSSPTNSTNKIRFMPSNLGGMQLHYARLGGPEDFEYTFDVPAGGKYKLTARVVTTSAEQHLMLAANGATELTDIAVPFTIGQWNQTMPVEISLVKGKNVLRFSRPEPVKGLTIKDFMLTPVK